MRSMTPTRERHPSRLEPGSPAVSDRADATAEPSGTAGLEDALLGDLKTRALSGGFVTAIAQGSKFALNMAAVVLLARLLSPQEFGLVAMAGAIVAFLGVLKDAGLSTATVQRASITHEQVSSLFWINVGLGTVMSLVAVALAPLVAWFYRDARLVGIMATLAATFVLTGATVQHHALLIRQMRFKVLATIEVGAMLAGVATATGMAAVGFSYWSLVGLQIATAGTALLLTWSVSRWRPSLPRHAAGVRPLLAFGAHMTLGSIVAKMVSGCDSLLIGRVYGAEPLGLYSRASVLLFRPLEQVLMPVGSVLLPVLSRLQSDPERYRRTFLRVYETLAVLTFSFTGLMLALSQPLVLTLLGPAWEGAVPLFAGFTLAALYLPLAFAANWLLTTQGRGRDVLRSDVTLSGITLLAFVVGLPFGPLGVAIAFSASGLLFRLPILYHLAGRSGPVRTADLWRVFLSNLPCWIIVYGATSLAGAVLTDVSPLTELVVCGSVGLAVAVGALFVLDRPRATALYALSTLRMHFARSSG
jgi:O-antigen/teichoic acid export membrane protein